MNELKVGYTFPLTSTTFSIALILLGFQRVFVYAPFFYLSTPLQPLVKN